VRNDVPAEFAEALADLRGQGVRPGVHVEEIAAPVRVAPYSVALSGEVSDADAGPDADPPATGRFVKVSMCDHTTDGGRRGRGLGQDLQIEQAIQLRPAAIGIGCGSSVGRGCRGVL
jgi:hypothetical protein